MGEGGRGMGGSEWSGGEKTGEGGREIPEKSAAIMYARSSPPPLLPPPQAATLLSGLAQRPPQHRAICLRLAVSALESAAGAAVAFTAAPPPHMGGGTPTPASASVSAGSASATVSDSALAPTAAATSARDQVITQFPFLAATEDRSVVGVEEGQQVLLASC